jgi:hypothetical protein
MERTITIVATVYDDGRDAGPSASYTEHYDGAFVTPAFALTHMRGVLFEHDWCPGTDIDIVITDADGNVI